MSDDIGVRREHAPRKLLKRLARVEVLVQVRQRNCWSLDAVKQQ
jgi:hypothetical protein